MFDCTRAQKCPRFASQPAAACHSPALSCYPFRPSRNTAAPTSRLPRPARWNAAPKLSCPQSPEPMRLAGIALAPLLVSPLAPPPRRGSVAAAPAEAARKPRALRRVRCSVTAASVGGGDAGELPRATLLWRAAKLPIYCVALVPLTVSSCEPLPPQRQCRPLRMFRFFWQPDCKIRLFVQFRTGILEL